MKRVRYRLVSVLLCGVPIVPGLAEEKIGEKGPPGNIQVQAACDLQGYKSGVQPLVPPVSIADNTTVTVGPIVLPADGTLIGDVVIDVQWDHSWFGDLIATVSYDETCDGAVDVSSVILCRPGRATCVGGTGFGCSNDLSCNNVYNFDDTGAVMPLPATCADADVVPAGCYRPTGVGAGTLSVFDSRRKGGCWFLSVSDNASGDTGQICEWSVHVLNQMPVGVEQASWGTVKKLFD